MFVARRSLLLFLGAVTGGLAVLPPQGDVRGRRPADDGWEGHPALAEPDGRSRRGDKAVAADAGDPRVLAELSRRFRQTKPLQLTPQGDVRGAEDFERRQEYLLRLLDYYWFSKPRLVGMTRVEVEAIFGPLGHDTQRADIPDGRDLLHL